MHEILKLLAEREGHYIGDGINHDNENFKGKFSISPIINNHGIEITFTATGDDGIVYHTEKTTIALSHNDDRPYMWSINSNTSYLFQHKLRKNEIFGDQNRRFVFGLNDPSNKDLFREEIQLDLLSNEEIGYHYYWGMPGEDFAYRSGLQMKKIL